MWYFIFMPKEIPFIPEDKRSMRIARIASLPTFVVGEVVTVCETMNHPSPEVFFGGTYATLGATILAATLTPRIFNRFRPPSN
jgi:hypothetical protein